MFAKKCFALQLLFILMSIVTFGTILVKSQNIYSKIDFYLFKNSDPSTPLIFKNVADLPENSFPTNTSLKILCHGWLSNGTLPWVIDMKDNYIKAGIQTVISVDWGKEAEGFYKTVMPRVPSIGQQVGDMIVNLKDKHGVSLENVHLIGHSLGAQIMGVAGQRVISLTKSLVARITGLDPAGPGFNLPPSFLHLTQQDAEFVDIIHTSLLGEIFSAGHADFYPNGGEEQTGCEFLSHCSHSRSRTFFNASIFVEFPAWKCDSYADFQEGKCFNNSMVSMGESCSNTARGSYFLDTNSEHPYAKTEYLKS